MSLLSIEELKKEIAQKTKIKEAIIKNGYNDKINQFKINYENALKEKKNEEEKKIEENFKNEEYNKVLIQKKYNLLIENNNELLKTKREEYNKLKDEEDNLNNQINEYNKKIEEILKKINSQNRENMEVEKNILKLKNNT